MARRALICEDDPLIRTLVTTVVRREGFEVDAVADGAEGVEKLKSDHYALVILDLMMPGVDGYAVMEFLRKTQSKVLKRVIVMTAASVQARDFPAPICVLLAKPFDIAQLTAALRECSEECSEREQILLGPDGGSRGGQTTE